MKMLKTLLVSVLFVAQASAVSNSDSKKARLDAAIFKIEFNLGLIKKKSAQKIGMVSNIGKMINNNKGKITFGLGFATAAYLAYKNPEVVVNGLSMAKDFLFKKAAQVVQPTIVQPITPVNEVFGKMHAENLFAPLITPVKEVFVKMYTENLFKKSVQIVTKNIIEVGNKVLGNQLPQVPGFEKNVPNLVIEEIVSQATGSNLFSYFTPRNGLIAAGLAGAAVMAGPVVLPGLALKVALLWAGY